MTKKVLFFSSKLHSGGAERILSIITNELSKELEVDILIVNKKSSKDYPTNARIFSLDSNVNRVNLFKVKQLSKRLKEFVDKGKYDVVVSFMEYPNMVNLLSPHHARKIISVRNHMSMKWHGFKGFLWKKSFKLLYNKCDNLVSPSQEIYKDMVKSYGVDSDKIVVINNPINFDIISEQKTQRIVGDSFNESTFNIISVGSLVKNKGVHKLIKVASSLKNLNIDYKLHILGDGNYLQYLKDLVETYGLSKRVHFYGRVSNPYKYLHNSDLFVLPSYYEGFPNVLLEAVAVGLPVISTNCKSGPSEILEFKRNKLKYGEIFQLDNGYIIPVLNEKFEANNTLQEDEVLLEKAIIDIYLNRNLYIKPLSSSIDLSRKYELNDIIKQWSLVLQHWR